MWKKLKKIHNLFSKKSVILLLVCVVGFGLFAPIASTQICQALTSDLSIISGSTSGMLNTLGSAVTFDFLGKVGTPVFNAFLTGFFMLLMTIGTVFLEASGALLNWVISPDFITLKFTDNDFVNEGWGIVRNFVNMFFILILVIIGLSTALRIKEYEAQKTLPLLIGMALLINFTPMICGLFIDVSNIIMNFFLDGVGLGLGRGVEQLGISWRHFASMISTASPASILGYGFSMALFTFITAFVYIIFALLFIIRYLALWILVILSPLAFFAYILPATRGAWKMWWQQFTQWCIIGIGGAFFLYLAEVMNVKLADVITSPPASAGNEEMNAITAFFPFLIPIVFLIIGVFATISTSAIGATQGISVVTKGGRLAGGKALSAARGTQTGQKVEGWARQKAEKIPLSGRLPGDYKMEQEAIRKKKVEAARTLDTDSIKERTKAFGISHQEKLDYQQVLFEKGELTDIEENKFIGEATSRERNLKESYEKRPDSAPNVEKQIKGETPKKFVEQTNAKALGNIRVIIAAAKDNAKIKELGNKGKTEQKQSYRQGIIQNQGDINQTINELKQEATKLTNQGRDAEAQSKTQQADNIKNNTDRILNDPNFV